jgi:S1-C subfamily serine protease
MRIKPITLLAWAGLLLFSSPAARTQDALTAASKKIFEARQDSVVWVSAVAKVAFSAEGAKDSPMNLPDQENKVEALGTIIDPEGLVVTALNQLDPARNISGREFRMGGNLVKIEATATLKEVKVTMPDGTEIPAEMVMKDADLDLAFVRIKTASKEAKGVAIKALDLKAAGPAQIADEVVTIGRADEVLNRVPTVARGQVTAATRKPREFLRVTGATQGCPTFLMDGRLVGIAVTRTVRSKSSATVVLPAADVLEIAEQVKRTPAPAGKETKPKRES